MSNLVGNPKTGFLTMKLKLCWKFLHHASVLTASEKLTVNCLHLPPPPPPPPNSDFIIYKQMQFSSKFKPWCCFSAVIQILCGSLSLVLCIEVLSLSDLLISFFPKSICHLSEPNFIIDKIDFHRQLITNKLCPQ